MNFKVGDRVCCLEIVDDNHNVEGATGVVKIVQDELIGVDFQKDVQGHRLMDWDNDTAHAEDGEGWWCYPGSLRKVNMRFTNK